MIRLMCGLALLVLIETSSVELDINIHYPKVHYTWSVQQPSANWRAVLLQPSLLPPTVSMKNNIIEYERGRHLQNHICSHKLVNIAWKFVQSTSGFRGEVGPGPLWATDRRTRSLTASVRRRKRGPLSSLVHTGDYSRRCFRRLQSPKCHKKTATTVTETIAKLHNLGICWGFVVQQIHNSVTFTSPIHDVDLRLNFHVLISLRHNVTSRLSNNGIWTSKLSRRIDNGNIFSHLLQNAVPVGHKIRKFTRILSFCFVPHLDMMIGLRYDDMMIVQHTNSANCVLKLHVNRFSTFRDRDI